MKQFSKDLGNVSLAPKGKWSREQEYERLALVYNVCDNLSYVAKINVPSGVDIENREYWQPMNATGYADNNFINLTTENENGTITAYETLEEAVATVIPINRRAGATLSFYNLNSDRLDRQAEFELWQFNSTDLANWENRDYWNNIYYNWNVFAGWYVGADALKNHVKIPNVGQYAYVGSNLNDAVLYQCRTNGVWTNTGIKVRNYISVVVSGNITIGDNGNWFSDGEDTGIPATPAVDEQLDNIIMQLQQHTTEINNIKAFDKNLQDQITNLPDNEDLTSVDNGTGSNVLKFADKIYNVDNFSGKGYKILRKNIKEDLDVPQDAVLFDNVVNVDYSNKIIDYDSLSDSRKFIRGLVLNLFDNKFYAIIYMGRGTYNVALTWTSNKYDYNNYYNSNSIKEGIYKSLLGDVYEYKDGKFVEFTQSSHTDNVLEQDMIPADASILEIKYDFSLSGKPIKFPDNTTLFFNGGKLINGTILGKNIHIINKSGIIFDNIITLGNYNYDIHYYEFANMSDDDLFTSMTHFDNCYFQAKTYDIYREYGDYNFWVGLNSNTSEYNYRSPNVCNIHGNNACFIIHNDDKRYYTGLIQFKYSSNTNSVVNINNIRIYSNNLIDINVDSSGASSYFHLNQNLQNSNIVGFTCDNVIAKVNFNLVSTINSYSKTNNGNVLIINNSDILCKNYFISEYYGNYSNKEFDFPIKAKSKMILENSKFYSSRDWSFSGINNDADIVVRNCMGKFGFENDNSFKPTIEIYNCNITSLYISPNLERLKIRDSIIGNYLGYLGKESYIENTNFIINYNTLDIDIVMSDNLIFKRFNFLKMRDCTISNPKRVMNLSCVDILLNEGAKLDIYNCTFNSKVNITNASNNSIKIEDLDKKIFYTNTFAGGVISGNTWIETDNLNPMTSDFILKEMFLDIALNKVQPITDRPIKLSNVSDFIYFKNYKNVLDVNTEIGVYEYRLSTTTVNENDIINIVINDDMYVKQIVADNTYSGLDLVTFLQGILNADTNYTNKFTVRIYSSLSRLYLCSSVIPFYGETGISINGSLLKPDYVAQPMCPVFTRSDGKGFYKNIGTTEERNNIKFIYTKYETSKNPVYYDIGFRFFNTDTKEYNIYAGNGKWINEKGHPADIKYKGTFLERPTGDDTPIGFEYFCTDKQTVEGTTNGIIIYHKGGDVWVDALGRVVN